MCNATLQKLPVHIFIFLKKPLLTGQVFKGGMEIIQYKDFKIFSINTQEHIVKQLALMVLVKNKNCHCHGNLIGFDN